MKQPNKKSTRGPGHHWDDLTPSERSAIGQKAARTKQRKVLAKKLDELQTLVTSLRSFLDA